LEKQNCVEGIIALGVPQVMAGRFHNGGALDDVGIQSIRPVSLALGAPLLAAFFAPALVCTLALDTHSFGCFGNAQLLGYM
jgi:hypothetical protein